MQVLATDGTNFSPVISETYMTDIVDGNTRLSHAGTNSPINSPSPDLYPFGTAPYEPNSQYTNPANSGVTVDNPALPTISNGFNVDGYPSVFTNEPYNSENYQIIYSTTNAEGETGHGVGTLPAKSTIQQPIPVPEQTNQFSNMFDPRAMVIFQDFSQENPNDPPTINRQFFTLENPNARDGTHYFDADGSGVPPSGTFIRSEYNPRDNTLTCYFRDSWSNRWIISKSPYTPGPDAVTNLSPVASAWGGRVFEWVAFQRRVLF